MVNVDLPDVRRSRGDPADDPRNRRIIEAAYSRERGAILVGKRPDRREQADRRQLRVPAHLRRAVEVRPRHGLLLLLRPDRHRAAPRTRVLSGDDDPLFVTRLVDLLSSKSTGKGGNVQLTIDRAAQDAACEGLRPCPATCRRRWSRSSRAPARSWRWPRCRPSTPTSSPPTTSAPSHDADEQLNDGRRRAADQPRDLDHAAARLDVQARHRRGRDRERRLRRRRRRSPAASSSSCRSHRRSGLINNDGRNCGGRRITVDPARWQDSCNTTFAPARPYELGAEEMQEQAEAFGFNQNYLDDLGPPGRESHYPRRRRPAADRPVRHRPVEVQPRPRCRWRWSPQASPTRATVMRPYLVDEVQSPDLDDTATDRPRGAIRGRVSRTTAEELTQMMVAPSTTAPPRRRDPRRRGRRQDRHRAERQPTGRRTPGSSRSPRPTTPRSRSR